MIAAPRLGFPYARELYQALSLLYLVALGVAAIRMDRDVSLVKPLAVTAIAALRCRFITQTADEDRQLVHPASSRSPGRLAVFISEPARRQFSGLLACSTPPSPVSVVVLSVTEAQAGAPSARRAGSSTSCSRCSSASA
jgi:hypothetical protein